MASSKNTEQAMFNIARGFASLATTKAKRLAPNEHLRASIRSRVETKGKGKFIIRVQASGPDAAAREYGSGVHARRARMSPHQISPRGKILIKPRERKALAFHWEKAHESLPRLPDGRVVLPEVKHPGVEAANHGEGYIGPAMKETRRDIKKRLKEISYAMRVDVRASITKGMKNAR